MIHLTLVCDGKICQAVDCSAFDCKLTPSATRFGLSIHGFSQLFTISFLKRITTFHIADGIFLLLVYCVYTLSNDPGLPGCSSLR